MKRKWILIVALAGILVLTGCSANTERLAEPTFPLAQSDIQAVLDELSLPWIIIQEGTRHSFYDQEATMFSLRDIEKKLNEESENTILYAGISSGIERGSRELDVSLAAGSFGLAEKPFAWEDWKQEIILATILYGGFESREEVYRALARLDVPEDDRGFKQGVSLSNGYCVVTKSKSRPVSGDYVVWIHFYASEALYREAEAIIAEIT